MPSQQKQSGKRGTKWMWSWRMHWQYLMNYRHIKARAKRYERYRHTLKKTEVCWCLTYAYALIKFIQNQLFTVCTLIRTQMSWRNNIGGFKISSHSMFIWFEILCSAQSRLGMSECQCDWYSCCHGYCCYTDTVAMEWHLLQNESECFFYIFFLIHSKERGAFLFYVSTLSNYFIEPHVFGNSKAHWGREKKHWLDVLPSVIMEKHNE